MGLGVLKFLPLIIKIIVGIIPTCRFRADENSPLGELYRETCTSGCMDKLNKLGNELVILSKAADGFSQEAGTENAAGLSTPFLNHDCVFLAQVENLATQA